MSVKHPPALLVGGTDAHRRRVFIREFIAKCSREGFTSHPLDGGDRGGMQNFMATVGVLFPIPTLLVVSNPEKITPEDVQGHLQSPISSLVLLLVSEQDKPSGGILDGFPANHTKLFNLPPFYKLDEYAAEYARELAKSRGVSLPDGLARAMVKLVGNDLGVVSFEVDKVVRLASALGVTMVEAGHLKATLAPLSEMDGTSLVDALGARNIRTISDELSRYKRSKKGDPTIEVCGRVLTPAVLRWFQAAYYHSHGVTPAGAAGRVGSSPWYWEHRVLPCARNWGVDGCRTLLGVIATAQESVFSGAVSPWGILESGLLRATQAPRLLVDTPP